MEETIALPKAINCRIGDADNDIREDLMNHAKDKTERIKAVYRMGLAYEDIQKKRASEEDPVKRITTFRLVKPAIGLRPANSFTVDVYQKRIKELEEQLETIKAVLYKKSIRHSVDPSPSVMK